ncbi:hypothetical protein QE357_004401 [Siphonobacter sp. BAB-5404]|nr:hypothetical protein [Siphonobacter sp. SORGH_AS_0500]
MPGQMAELAVVAWAFQLIEQLAEELDRFGLERVDVL